MLVSQDVKSVEALILQSACYADLADHSTSESVLLRSRSDDRLRPRSSWRRAIPAPCFSPRMEGLAQAKPGSDGKATSIRAAAAGRAIVRSSLRHEHRRARAGDTPRRIWRSACELQSRGDQLGARNWIEKSLIAAPDYKAAQRQLAHLVRH